MLLREAQEALLGGRDKEAVNLFRAAVTEAPSNALAHQGFAQALLRTHSYEDAQLEARKALELDSHLAIPHVILAYNSNEKRDQESFRVEAAKAYELEPESIEVLVCYGVMLVVDKHLDQGIRALNEAVRLQPADHTARRNLAWALNLAGDRRGALWQARQAFSLRPSLRSAVRLLSMLYATYTPVFGIGLILCTFLALVLRSAYLLVPLSLVGLGALWLSLRLVFNRRWRLGVIGLTYAVLSLLIAVGAYLSIR